MDSDDKLYFYRLTNVAYGLLESMERSRSELMTLRHLQIAARQKSLGQRVVGILLSLVALIPAIYSLLPSRLGNLRLIWLTGVVVLAIGYIALALHQWQSDKKDAVNLLNLLPVGAEIQADHRPEFIGMLLSSYRTRWQMAQAVHNDVLDEVTKKQFGEIVDFWEHRMQAMLPRLKTLLENGKISQDNYDSLMKWFPPRVQEVQGPS